MTYHSALEYIRTAREHGLADHQIHARLAAAGWLPVDIRDAFVLSQKMERPVSATLAAAPEMAMPMHPMQSAPQAEPTPVPVHAGRTSSVKWTLWLIALLAVFFIGYSIMR